MTTHKQPKNAIQGTLFEEDYLLRTLGSIVHTPDIALTELVANAWDAGASRVDIIIPSDLEENMIVEDDGCGMTSKQFRERWMKLGYNRVKHQGKYAEMPPERESIRRPAYGRNGVGRHGLLCFAPKYKVETFRKKEGRRFLVTTVSQKDPFVIESEEIIDAKRHGTRLTAEVSRNLPAADRIREVLSARFLHDPQFTVSVNGKSVPLAEHTGLIEQTTLEIEENAKAEVYVIDATKSSKTTKQHGIAFWVGGRLVGKPTWTLGEVLVIDGRTKFAKRYTVVVRSDDFFDEILPDWSSFKDSERVKQFFNIISEYVNQVFLKVSEERIQETREAVLREHRTQLEMLQPLARLEVSEFVTEITTQQPTMQSETLSVAVKAVIQLEKSRSGSSLLEKLSKLSDEDIEGLDRLLGEWSVRDALTVLDEIDRRLAVIEAIGKLSSDRKVDELHTLHPLVTQARWLFGPEFDTPEYASNLSIRKAVEKVFDQRIDREQFINHLRRPDLLILSDATLSTVSLDEIDRGNGLNCLREVLLIELKRGGSTIGRQEMNQAFDYVEDLLGCGLLDGTPYMRAFVVGHEADPKIQEVRKFGENPERGRIQVCTYSQLVRTAERRLFRLKDRLTERYEDVTGESLLNKILAEPKQLKFTETNQS